MDNLQPRVGTILAGTYRIEGKLGEGGMGVVLRAKHVTTGQAVAIKLIRPEVASDEALARFEREARAVSTLRSDNVCRATEVGKLADGSPYMVMEYLEGEDLARLLERRGQLPIHEAVDVVVQMCAAMEEAHAAGIIHRDLKPKNVYLSPREGGGHLVKILDFGISKIATEEDLQLTRTTEIIGSPSYMSPEQLRASRDVDARTDIWALGVILFELLVNRIPFEAEVVTQLVAVVLMEREPSVRSFRREVPAGLEHIISRCLQKRPADRFQGVAELAYALKAFSQPVSEASSRSFGETAIMVPSAAPSSRVMVHGGTSVAWGETQIDPPKRRPVRWPAAFGALAALLVVGAGATWGATSHLRRANAAPGPVTTLAATEAMPLPPARKDLPPLDAPPSEIPPKTDPVETKTDATETKADAAPSSRLPMRPPTAKPPENPLRNIGRR